MMKIIRNDLLRVSLYNMLYNIVLLFSVFAILTNALQSQTSKNAIKLGRVKYSGGGDWYNDPSSEVNLLKFIKANTNIDVDPKYEFVDLSTDNIFQYPILFLTGHGNLKFSTQEARKLRAYLENGGFLYIDDDYGLDKYIRREMKKIFPNQEFAELPFSHGIYHSHYDFEYGPPKIHEHDDRVPQGFGLFHRGRMCVFYTFESNPADGWADPDVHSDLPVKREEALKMGTNIIVWALSN